MVALLFENTAAPVSLKLYSGWSAEPEDPSPYYSARKVGERVDEVAPPAAERMTLREAWEQFFRSEMERGRAANTISGDLTALNHWERRTTNPALNLISDETLSEFRESLLAGEASKAKEWTHPPLAMRTVAKTWRTLRKILLRVGPRMAGNPRGRSLIDVIPHMELGAAGKIARKRMVSLDEVDRLYEAFGAATWPVLPLVPPAMFWRAALSIWWVYGHRTQDVVSTVGVASDLTQTPPLNAGLLWSSICRDRRCPDPDIQALSPWGWIDFTPRKTQRTSGVSLMLPLHELVAKHLDWLRGNDTNRVFNNARCQRAFYGEWRAARARAGIEWDLSPISFRSTCNTNWNAIDRARGLGAWIVGHSPRGVNAVHYDNPTAEIVEALPRLPMPDCFRRSLETHRQGRLFD